MSSLAVPDTHLNVWPGSEYDNCGTKQEYPFFFSRCTYCVPKSSYIFLYQEKRKPNNIRSSPSTSSRGSPRQVYVPELHHDSLNVLMEEIERTTNLSGTYSWTVSATRSRKRKGDQQERKVTNRLGNVGLETTCDEQCRRNVYRVPPPPRFGLVPCPLASQLSPTRARERGEALDVFQRRWPGVRGMVLRWVKAVTAVLR
jgi:hypothetical protein